MRMAHQQLYSETTSTIRQKQKDQTKEKLNAFLNGHQTAEPSSCNGISDVEVYFLLLEWL